MSEQKLVVPSRSVFAAVLLKATAEPHPEKGAGWPTVVHLTSMILELKENYHLDTSHISIRADKDGWTSDDLSSFVNGFVLFGLVTHSPIKLSPEARQECEEILREDSSDSPDAVKRLTGALGLEWAAVHKPVSAAALTR